MNIQNAGTNSTQVQASVVNINCGMTEERAREIYKEDFKKIESFTQEAKQIAIQRVDELEKKVIPRLSKLEHGLEFFSKPDFQFLLMDAQKTATRVERKEDIDILSELLIQRVRNDKNREIRLGVKKAIEIVDCVPDDALLGLTVIQSITSLITIIGNVDYGLAVLDLIFKKIMYDKLPEGEQWLETLDLIGAIRIDKYERLSSLTDYYSSVFDGYVCVGILKNSENYNKALSLLERTRFSSGFLVSNVLNLDYVRLNISRFASIYPSSKDVFPCMSSPLSEYEASVLKEIISMYDKNSALIQKAKQRFSETWEKYQNLSLVRQWWESLPYSFSLTIVGKILGDANAKKYEKELPPLQF